MVPRMMVRRPAACSTLVRSHGVTVHTGARVDAIEPGGVRLADGVLVEADLVITATGVRPNVRFLDGGGVKVGQEC